jgi:hypothetical protein
VQASVLSLPGRGGRAWTVRVMRICPAARSAAYHRDHPYVFDVEGYRASIDYQPAESTTPMFGGNSNWRGPIWFPLNYLVIAMLERYHQFFAGTPCHPGVGSGARPCRARGSTRRLSSSLPARRGSSRSASQPSKKGWTRR